LRSRPRGCKLADVFTVFVLLLMVVIAFAMGFGPQFNGPFAIAAVVFLLLGAFADIAWRRFPTTLIQPTARPDPPAPC
jgi:hypothetical protein